MDKTKVLILYYSMYGNTFEMAKAVGEGVKEVDGVEVTLRQVPELLPENVIEGNREIQKAKEMQKEIPIISLDDLKRCDALILGSPTRFGNMCAQVRNFLDQTGKLWQEGALIGKPAGVFTSTTSLHGGQETTLVSMMHTLFHHGMVVVGVPYSISELISTKTGGTPYGPSHVAGMGLTPLSSDEITIAKALGRRVAELAKQSISARVPERKALVTFKGEPITLLGEELKVGDKAPEFYVVDNEVKPVKLSDFAGKVVLTSVTPSLDTPVCNLQAGRFNQLATEASKGVVILNISVDLPFALARWCSATGSEQIKTLSDYQDRDFGIKYGVLVKELKLLARSVWLIDRKGVIRYIELVPEMTHEPDYDKALEALKRVIG